MQTTARLAYWDFRSGATYGSRWWERPRDRHLNDMTEANPAAISTIKASVGGDPSVDPDASGSVEVGGAVGIGPPVVAVPPAVGGRGVGLGAGGGTTARGTGVGRGVGRGVAGASARGPNSPTMALGWMLRSWLRLPEPSSWSVRMCHGAPDTSPAPSRGPPPAMFQYRDWARWPPQARSTADLVDVKWTTNSAVLLPDVDPACFGPLMELIVPPQIVSRRDTPE
jgi:hypothetical protein